MRFAIAVINVGIHNLVSKKLLNKNEKEVVVLVGTSGTKQNDLWRF